MRLFILPGRGFTGLSIFVQRVGEAPSPPFRCFAPPHSRPKWRPSDGDRRGSRQFSSPGDEGGDGGEQLVIFRVSRGDDDAFRRQEERFAPLLYLDAIVRIAFTSAEIRTSIPSRCKSAFKTMRLAWGIVSSSKMRRTSPRWRLLSPLGAERAASAPERPPPTTI